MKWHRKLRYAIGEIVIIAIGLFIGFQIDNWKESWQLQQEKRALLVSLAQDLDRDTSLLQACAAEARSAAASADLLLQQLDRATPMAVDSVGQKLQPLLSYIDVPLNNASFSLFISSGKLTLLHDDDLERQLHSYYNRIAHIYRSWTAWDKEWSSQRLVSLRQLSFARSASLTHNNWQVKPTFWAELREDEPLQALLFSTWESQRAMAQAMEAILSQNRKLAGHIRNTLSS